MRSGVVSRWSLGRYGTLWLVLGLLAGFAIALAAGVPGKVWAQETPAQQEPPELEEDSPTGAESMIVNPVEIDLHEDTTVWIYGSGFAPGTEVILLVEDQNGVMTDITAAGTVFPLEVNDQGAWATLWTLGGFADEGVAGESIQSLWAMDNEFNTLASAPVAFCATSLRAEAPEPEPTPTPAPAEPPATPVPGTPTPEPDVTPTPDATPLPAPGGASGQPLLQEEQEAEVPDWCSA